ncbi:DHH family phosphoesterase [Candidatus Woesearchaeota archaeon]|nr:DHH family phosphoesterase [Candidatus Woesearchaeota archaeon]
MMVRQGSGEKDFSGFFSSVDLAVERFRAIPKNENIRIISHLDADGISAAAVMIRALSREKRPYSISIIHNLDKNSAEVLMNEDHKHYIFTDLGSGQLDLVVRYLKGRDVFILDHHRPGHGIRVPENITHVNPHLSGIDGTAGISGSGVVYFFARSMDRRNEDMAHIAIVGAIGDLQEHNGFDHLNDIILKDALKAGNISVFRGLRLFGVQTKPLYKVLANSMDPFIPGVTGSETDAIGFLRGLGIDPKKGSAWKKLVNLDRKEMKRLIGGIIMKRMSEDNPEDILGTIYVLPKEEKESPTRDAREFATLLNSCGRLGKASLGIGTCLGDRKYLNKAIANMNSYRRELIVAMKWFEAQRKNKSGLVVEGDGFVIVNAQDNVMPTIVGTLASMIAKSGFSRDTLVVAMAQQVDGNTKISMRRSFSSEKRDYDLKDLLDRSMRNLGGQSGGHMSAAGALIPSSKEQQFIRQVRSVLKEELMSESVG